MNMATVERAAPAVASGQVRAVAPRSQLSRQRVRAAWLFLAPMLVGPCGGRRLAAAPHDLVRLHRRQARRISARQVHRLPQLSRICRLRRRDRRVVRPARRPVWWHAVRNTICVHGRLGTSRDRPRHGRRAGAQRPFPRPRPDPRRGADPLGDPDRRLGQDVGLDVQRPVRHHQRHPASGSALIAQPIAWTAIAGHRAGRGDHRRHLEDDAVHGAPASSPACRCCPAKCYEAAKVDGVHPIKVFWRVTLPLSGRR